MTEFPFGKVPFGYNPYVATPQQVHQLEQVWQMADKELDALIALITAQIEHTARLAELDAYSPSFAFDWIKAYMMRVVSQYPPEKALQLLFMLTSSALAKLVCAPHTRETDDILAQLEKGINSDDR
jgi:hypothetical protein